MERHQFLDFLSTIEAPTGIETWSGAHMNWQVNLDRAGKLGIGPLVYARMKENGVIPFVPQAIIEPYKSRFYWNQVRNMKRLGRLKAVLTACSSEHIPIIVLKGAALAELVYPDIGCRPMRDADLLVKQEDILRVEQLLISLGYRPNEKNHSKDWYQKNHHHIVPYISADRSLVIEIHHHLVLSSLPVHIPNSDLWERACPAHIAGVACWILSAEDILIHLALALAVDRYFGKIRGLYDLAETIAHYEGDIDWDKLLQLAQAYGISKYLYYAFWLAQSIVRADVPLSTLRILKARFHGLPLEERFFKMVIQKVVVLYEPDKHAFYMWWLQTTCLDFLSTQARSEKLRKIMYRAVQSYTEFARIHAQKSWMPLSVYPVIGYPFYLMRKAVGLHSRPDIHKKKRSS